MDVITAYRQVGTYRGAAEMCGLTHKTVKRIIDKVEAAEQRVARRKNYESVRSLVAQEISETKGKISAKRLLPKAHAAGYAGSARNFRRLVAQERAKYRQSQAIAQARRPGVWTAGEHLVIDWGVLNGLHVFCAVLAWSRIRFVRFATDERAATTFALLAECFEVLGGVPKVVLADRMGCLKGGVVADVVIPTPDYVRFATHYRFRPDFCHAHDPESKGIVEALVGYSKTDLMVPLGVLSRQVTGSAGLAAANEAAKAWCGEVNASRLGLRLPANWNIYGRDSPVLRVLKHLTLLNLRAGRRGDDQLGVRVMVDPRRAGDGHGGSGPRLFSQHERQFLQQPVRHVLQLLGGVTVADDQQALLLIEVALHPHRGVQPRCKLFADDASPLDPDEVGARGDGDRSGPVVGDPGIRAEVHRLAPVHGLQNVLDEHGAPVEVGVVPGDVVGVHDGGVGHHLA